MELSILVKLVGEDWADFLKPFMCPDAEGRCAYDAIGNQLKALYGGPPEQQPFPNKANVFRAFKETPLSKVRVVILGQDPYPKPGYANGLAFATDSTEQLPPSLVKINDAIEKDVYNGMDLVKKLRTGNLGKPKEDGTINKWTDQGVLLLNTALTIGMVNNPSRGWIADPGSHDTLWQPFTDFVVSNIWRIKRNLIFMAWGSKAKNYTWYQGTDTPDEQTADSKFKGRGVSVFHSFLLTSEHPAAAVHRDVEARKINPDAPPSDWVTDNFSRANLIIRINQLGEPIEW